MRICLWNKVGAESSPEEQTQSESSRRHMGGKYETNAQKLDTLERKTTQTVAVCVKAEVFGLIVDQRF